MAFKIEQIENRNHWRGNKSNKYDKQMRNRKLRRGTKSLDKKVETLEHWHDSDEEGKFSKEADYQYPNPKEFKGYEF
jgi:hypothetical protein